MSHILARPLRLAVPALFLGAVLIPAAASAQVLIYEEPYGPPPGYYGGQVPSRVPRYPILAPREIMNIVRGMGYWRVSVPRLAGGTYVVAAADEEGPVMLRINAATGRVLSARSVNGGPTIAVPSPQPHRQAPPSAQPRSAAPPVARLAPNPAPGAPMPPSRPPEASVTAVTPAPGDVPAPGAVPAAPGTPPAASPSAVSPSASPAAPQATAPASAAPSAQTPSVAAPPAATTSAPASPVDASAKPVVSQEAQANPAPTASRGPVNRKAGTGTTPGSASAGTASVLSKPKTAN